jgi:hypothetical protein
MHAGELICGVMSKARFCFDVMVSCMMLGCLLRAEHEAKGETVNLAARMESMSEPGQVLCTEEIAALLQPLGFVFADRGVVNVRGMGPKHAYFLVRYDGDGLLLQ